MKYFAYGSNMDVAQMDDRCPGAPVQANAKLNDFRFVINSRGVASIVDAPGSVVHGVLWEISPADERTLDRYEGLRKGLYSKTTVTVETGVGIVDDVLTYTATDSNAGPSRSGYQEKIVAAARSHELPSGYIEELEGWTNLA